MTRDVEGRLGMSPEVSNTSSRRLESRAVCGLANADPISFNVSDRARTFREGATAGMWCGLHARWTSALRSSTIVFNSNTSLSRSMPPLSAYGLRNDCRERFRFSLFLSPDGLVVAGEALDAAVCGCNELKEERVDTVSVSTRCSSVGESIDAALVHDSGFGDTVAQ